MIDGKIVIVRFWFFLLLVALLQKILISNNISWIRKILLTLIVLIIKIFDMIIKSWNKITFRNFLQQSRQHAEGISANEIALYVGLDRSTIYRELKRNSYRGETYSPDSAHMMASQRRNRPGTKIGRSKYLQTFLSDSLAMELSPQVISGRLALESGEHNKVVLSHLLRGV